MRRDQVPANVDRKDVSEAADARLRREVEHAVHAGQIERLLGQIAAQHVEPAGVLLFFGRVVVVGEAVDADDVVAILEQRVRKLRADEPGGSGDDVSHREREVIPAV
jgi:hypothetical protein